MQPGEQIESLLDEIEQIIDESKSPLTGGRNMKIVDSAEIDEIRDRFPQEFADSRRIVREEQDMLDRAQQQADSIISDAQQQAVILAGDQEVVRLAQQQADQIRDQASQYERDTRYNAESYADSVLANLEDHLHSMAGSVQRVRQTIEDGSSQNQDNQGW